MAAPLITSLYLADPSAHVFDGKVYIYPSHDRETGVASNDNGDQYDMVDYHVVSVPDLTQMSAIIDHGVALSIESIPWVARQLWAPDAARKGEDYYLYFPAKDKNGRFRIGVAMSYSPVGPFTPDPEPIPGSFSIDPAVFVDGDENDDRAAAYMYFGGLWGGQLQCYQRGVGSFDPSWLGPKEPSGEGVPAMGPRVAKLTADMRGFEGEVREVEILAPETGQRLAADDHKRRFFEGAWMHRRGNVYYLSYSTGDTHYLCYARGDNPLGPFTYGGRILEPVIGWTTHHSIVEYDGRWWLFYHDAQLSGGVDHLRSIKVKELFYDHQGGIITMWP